MSTDVRHRRVRRPAPDRARLARVSPTLLRVGGGTSLPSGCRHILVHGVPVQFLPAHNALAEAAVATARTLDYGVPVRVIDPEHLVALAFQAGGHRRRERAWQILEVGVVDRQRLRALLSAHGIMMDIDDGT